MNIKCDHCGFEGQKHLFKYISFDESIEMRQCPKCLQHVECDLAEMFDNNLLEAEKLSKRLEKAVSAKNITVAKDLLRELDRLNQSLSFDGLNTFLKAMSRKIFALEKMKKS